MYKKINLFLQKFISKSTIYKYLFNLSPMYRRTCGRIIHVTDDLSCITVRIRLSYKNINYNGSMFGGSLFSATDPIFMIQFNELLGHKYVIWDKTAKIQFKRPAKENVWIDFKVSGEELQNVREQADENGSYTFMKQVDLTNKCKTIVFATVEKEIYVATKEFYKKRQEEKKSLRENVNQ